MMIALHKNARATPAIRAEIATSTDSAEVTALAIIALRQERRAASSREMCRCFVSASLALLVEKAHFFIAGSIDGIGRHKRKTPSKSITWGSVLAERTGLEPATPGVTGRYSNQLNYHSW